MSFASGWGRKQEASGPAPRAEFIPRELRQVAAPLQRRQDAFHTMHADSTLVKSFLSSLQIGELASDEPSSEPSKNKQLIDDFRELRATITKMGLMKPNIFFYLCLLLHIILLEAAAWLTLLYCGTSLLPFTASLIFLTTSQIQASWLQHDLGHFSVFPKTKWNRRFQKFVMNHLIGGSSKWWNLLHNQHHVKPNCYSKDPDVSFHPFLFAFGKNLSVELGIKMTKYMPYNHQHKYFSIILPPLLIPALFHYHNFFVIFKKKFWMDLACMVSFFFRFFFISWNLLGVNCLIFYLLLRMLVSCWFVWVSQMSHIPMDIDYDKNLDWFSTQLKATCNVEQSLFNDWFTGHLNFQIEHHLFPSMPRHNFWKAAPLVKSLCAKHSIEYQCKPLLKAFADILHSLKEYGDLWLDAYLHK